MTAGPETTAESTAPGATPRLESTAPGAIVGSGRPSVAAPQATVRLNSPAQGGDPTQKENILDPSNTLPDLPDCEPMLIGGEWTTGSARERIPVLDPATRKQLTTIAQAGPEEVSAAVAAATAAHRDRRWRGLPPRQRRDVLLRLADLVERDAEQLAVLDTLDNGKAIERARGDVELGLQAIRHFAGTPTRLTGTVHAAAADRHVYSVREPVGVVAAVLPWNFPFMIAAWKVAPGPGRRLHGRGQAGRADSADRAAAGRALPGGGRSRGGGQRGDR